MDVCCECYLLSGRGLCDELIIRPEESYRLWCVVVCDIETSGMRGPWPTGWGGECCVTKKYFVRLCLYFFVQVDQVRICWTRGRWGVRDNERKNLLW
jgi:hypothetical protein